MGRDNGLSWLTKPKSKSSSGGDVHSTANTDNEGAPEAEAEAEAEGITDSPPKSESSDKDKGKVFSFAPCSKCPAALQIVCIGTGSCQADIIKSRGEVSGGAISTGIRGSGKDLRRTTEHNEQPGLERPTPPVSGIHKQADESLSHMRTDSGDSDSKISCGDVQVVRGLPGAGRERAKGVNKDEAGPHKVWTGEMGSSLVPKRSRAFEDKILTKDYLLNENTVFFPEITEERKETVRESIIEASWSKYEITQEFPWDGIDTHQEENVEQLKGVIGRMGAKSKLRDWLTPRFPKCHTYVEPFGGTLKVLMWKKRTARIEIVNDVDDDLIHFFRYVTFFPRELAALVNSMPTHQKLVEYLRGELKARALTGLERAAAVYYSLKLSFNGTGSGYAGSPTVLCSGRANEAEFVRVANRLKRVDIRSGNAHDLIRAINRRLDPVSYPGGMFFYFDPPYDDTAGYSTVHGKSTYGKIEQQDLFMLAKEVDEADNKFMMTNSSTDWLKERWCSIEGWDYVERDVNYTVSAKASARGATKELIVANFPISREIKTKQKQAGLFT